MPSDTAIVILAGGDATRLPQKLERNLGSSPLLLHVFNNVRGRWPVFIAGSSTFSTSLDAQLTCPLLIDRWPQQGPLAALVSAAGELPHRRIFALAGDAPSISLDALEQLDTAWNSHCEAVVAHRDGRSEPLLALYDSAALVREGRALFANGERSMRALLERLRVTPLSFASASFTNINTPADYARASATWARA